MISKCIGILALSALDSTLGIRLAGEVTQLDELSLVPTEGDPVSLSQVDSGSEAGYHFDAATGTWDSSNIVDTQYKSGSGLKNVYGTCSGNCGPGRCGCHRYRYPKLTRPDEWQVRPTGELSARRYPKGDYNSIFTPFTRQIQCRTNEIVVDKRCVCPAGLVVNPNKQDLGDVIFRTSYIVALESSETTQNNANNEDRWTKQKDAFDIVMQKLVGNSQLARSGSEVTAISYSDTAISRNYLSPSIGLSSVFVQGGTGRRYGEALEKITEAIQEGSRDDFRRFVVIMVTDGDAAPDDTQTVVLPVLRDLDPVREGQLDFFGFSLGDVDSTTLKDLVVDLNTAGANEKYKQERNFEQISDSDQMGLKYAFLRATPNVYTDCVCPDNKLLVGAECI